MEWKTNSWSRISESVQRIRNLIGIMTNVLAVYEIHGKFSAEFRLPFSMGSGSSEEKNCETVGQLTHYSTDFHKTVTKSDPAMSGNRTPITGDLLKLDEGHIFFKDSFRRHVFCFWTDFKEGISETVV